jgi:hypothetical protein
VVAVTDRGRAGLGALGVGLAVIGVATFAVPVPPPPLYDGIVPLEAYRWLDPPPPGEHGGAEGASAVIAVTGGSSPLVALATPELTPQAQIFAAPGDLALPTGTTSITATIEPLHSTVAAVGGSIAGNVYRITIVTQAGIAVTAPADTSVTIALRAPDPATPEAAIALLAGSSWQPIDTEPSGLGGSFLGIVTTFGDFGLLVPGPAPTPGGSLGPAQSRPAPAATAGPSATGATGESARGGIAPITIFAALGFAVVVVGLIVGALLPGRRRPPRPG